MPQEAIATDDQTLREGYRLEFEFVREGMRQDQRERQTFLGFALAANGAVLGLLVRPIKEGRSPGQALFLIAIGAAITIVAEVLTMRATLGVASAGVYLRKFIEPHVPGLAFQARNRLFLDRVGARISSSWGFAVAYGMLTTAFLVSWFTVDISTARTPLQTALVALFTCVSGLLTANLWWTARYGWKHVEDAWSAVQRDEGANTP